MYVTFLKHILVSYLRMVNILRPPGKKSAKYNVFFLRLYSFRFMNFDNLINQIFLDSSISQMRLVLLLDVWISLAINISFYNNNS